MRSKITHVFGGIRGGFSPPLGSRTKAFKSEPSREMLLYHRISFSSPPALTKITNYKDNYNYNETPFLYYWGLWSRYRISEKVTYWLRASIDVRVHLYILTCSKAEITAHWNKSYSGIDSLSRISTDQGHSLCGARM